jgi:hypothetical protein
MTSGFASWCRLARTAPPSTRSASGPQSIPTRHVFLGSRLRTPASSPPSLTTEQLPSACGWCHQPPQGTRTPELLVMSRAHRTCTFPRIRLKQAVRSGDTTPYDPLASTSISSSGPFATTIVGASNLSVGAGVIVIFVVKAHLTASAPFRAGPPGPYPAGYPGPPAEGWRSCPGFPLPFGRRRSLLGHPIPAGELGPPHGRLTGHAEGAPGPRRGYRVPHARAATGVGAPSTPRTAVLIAAKSSP